MQSETKVVEKKDKLQSPTCENNVQQPRLLSGQVDLDLESCSQTNAKTQWKVSEPSRVTSTMMPQHVVNHHPVVLDAVNPGILQSNSLMRNNAALHNVSNSALIGQDMWKQLKRVSVPIFYGDEKTYQNWKAAFTACVDQAPATAEYKLLQLKQCLAGEPLKATESLGHSAAAYQAAKERLERKFGGQCRQIAIYLEEIDSFRPVCLGNLKDMESMQIC